MLFYRLSMRFIIIYFSSALISSSICFAQLFPTDSNYYGDFEDGLMSGWYRNNQQEFSISSSEVFNGQNALKINTSSGCLMFNAAAADFNKTSGTTYSVGFYLKGIPGNSITVSLKMLEVPGMKYKKPKPLKNWDGHTIDLSYYHNQILRLVK